VSDPVLFRIRQVCATCSSNNLGLTSAPSKTIPAGFQCIECGHEVTRTQYLINEVEVSQEVFERRSTEERRKAGGR